MIHIIAYVASGAVGTELIHLAKICAHVFDHRHGRHVAALALAAAPRKARGEDRSLGRSSPPARPEAACALPAPGSAPVRVMPTVPRTARGSYAPPGWR